MLLRNNKEQNIYIAILQHLLHMQQPSQMLLLDDNNDNEKMFGETATERC